jgi:hypothetical protein
LRAFEKINQINQTIKDFKMSRGGARAGAGRKTGVPNKKTAAQKAAIKAAVEQAVSELPEVFEGDSYAFLAAAYKNMQLPFGLRMDAAKTAIAYERPRLSNVEMTTRSLDKMGDEDFFRAWDSVARFLAERGRPKLLEATAEKPAYAPFGEMTPAELEGGLSAAGRDTVPTITSRNRLSN